VANVDPRTPYCFCAEYTLEQVPQRIHLVFQGEPRPIGTDFLAGNIDEAEDFCDALNLQLGLNPEQTAEISATYINETCNGAPVLLRPADFKPWDREKAINGIDEFLPLYDEISKITSDDPEEQTNNNAEMIAHVAQTFDNLASQAGDNIALQLRHFEELKENPETWSNPDMRIHRAGELLRYLRSIQKQLADLRDRTVENYQRLTGEMPNLTPDFQPTGAGPTLVSAETGAPGG
jgi:hypothetical protein